MNILIISDSHGSPEKIAEALCLQIAKPAAVFFLGDGLGDLKHVDFGNIPVYAVAGNCDWHADGDTPTTLTVNVGGVTFFLTHGHTLGVKSNIDSAILAASQAGADVLLYGHTHERENSSYPAGEQVWFSKLAKSMQVFNPGSLGYGGNFGTAEIRDGKILLSHGSLYK